MTETAEPPVDDEAVPAKRARQEVMCEQCQTESSKYTCPSCAARSCSVNCVKKHKELNSCNGMPKNWEETLKYTQYTPEVSVKDQSFLADLRDQVSCRPNISGPSNAVVSTSSPERQPHKNGAVESPEDRKRLHHNGKLELNTRLRRIHLKITSDAELEGTRYDGFADTIFWAIKLRFMHSTGDWASISVPADNAEEVVTASKALVNYDSSPEKLSDDKEEGEATDDESVTEQPENPTELEIEETILPIDNSTCELKEHFSYTVNNIPESLTVQTLIRQFVKPKTYGPTVSKSDLDLEAMAPFLAEPESYLLYMPVDVEGTTKYYVIDRSRTIVDNLRNRIVVNRPEIIVVLSKDPAIFEQPTEEELIKLSPQQSRAVGSDEQRNRPQRDGFRHRGGGHHHHQQQRGFHQHQNREFRPREFRRGGGGHGGGGHGGGGHGGGGRGRQYGRRNQFHNRDENRPDIALERVFADGQPMA